MKRLGRSERGSSLAETALLMPLFLLILFGIVEGSVVLSSWMILTNETREAARYAIAGVRDGDTNLVTEVTTKFNGDLGGLLSTSALTLTITPTLAADGSGSVAAITVLAKYKVPMQTPFTQAVLGATVPISVSSTMRAE